MRSILSVLIMMAVVIVVATAVVTAQEQSRESMAVDATATQWSFQLAYDGAFDYRTDDISPGLQRPSSNKGFFQLPNGSTDTRRPSPFRSRCCRA